MFSVALQPDFGEQEVVEVPKNKPNPNNPTQIQLLFFHFILKLIITFFFFVYN
jgi:hypothetical protein